jgi:hypothetical protein
MKKILGGLAMLVLTASAAVAQVNFGSIRGTVTDSTGAVIKGATVHGVDQANGSEHDVVTNGKGEYEITNLNADPFKVTVTAPGFATSVVSLTVSVGSKNTANIKLATGTAETVVEVAADGFGGLNLESQEISQLVNQEQVMNLPSLNRDPYDFAALSGFAGSDASNAANGLSTSGGAQQGGTGALDFSGARAASVDILLDGAENTEVYGVGVGQTVPLDGVQEFRVIAADFPAQYGRASGGIVNVITKQGTNKIHGSLWEFNRISDLASNDYNSNALGLPKLGFTRNQFGYSVGGPIIKNKLFLFSTTEWIRVRSSSLSQATVALPGIISQAAPATQAFFTAYGALAAPVTASDPVYTLDYAGNTTYINELGCNPSTSSTCVAGSTAANRRITYQAAHPSVIFTAPSFATVYYNVPGDSGAGTPQNTYNNLENIQWVISDRTTLTGRYSIYSEADQVGSNASSPYSGYNTGSKSFDNNFLGTLNHTFSNSLSSSLKVLYSRLNNQQPLGTRPVSPTLYANTSAVPTLGNGLLQFPGYLPTAPGSAIPFGGPQNFGQVLNDTTWVKGNHVIVAGGQFLFIKDNRVFGAYDNAIEGLGPNGTSNTGAITNFLNGVVGQYEVAVNPEGEFPCVRNPSTGAYAVTAACTLQLPLSAPNFSRSNRYKDYAVYVQDSWKMIPRLNIDYGLRWEVYGPQHSQSAQYDANFFPGAGVNLIDRVAHGNVYTRANSPIGGLWQNNFTQFGPRIGFAYDLTGDGKTSLRGGFGISFERNFNNVTFNVIQNPPNYAVENFTTSANGNQPLSVANLGPLAAASGTATFGNPTLRAVNPGIRPAYTETYTLGIGREIAQGTSIELNYTGSNGVRNYSITGLNQSYYGGIYEGYAHASSRANLQYSSINFRGADGTSHFNGLDVALNSRNIYHSGLTLTAHYTWSHALDNTSSTFSSGSSNDANLGYLDPLNHALDYGSSDFDVRHRIVVAPVYAVPYFKNTTGLKKLALDGFQFSGIFQATTGNPFSEFDGSNEDVAKDPRATFLVPVAHKRSGPEVNISNLYGPNTFGYLQFPDYTPANYNMTVNPICGCADFGPFPTNMSHRNAFQGPGLWSFDAVAEKKFAINEKYGLTLRGEGFNVFNHANLYLNNGGNNDASVFNYALAYRTGRRRVQLAAQFTF